MIYERILAPLLFALEAESAHNLALSVLRRAGSHRTVLKFLSSRSGGADARLRRTVGGIDFPNPIGLAAGFDKNAVAVPALAALGFGFITVGTVTPGSGQPGRPKPRVFRDVEKRALWNRLGFNNLGADAMARVLERQGRPPIPLGISLGKAADTPLERAADDYADCLERLYPHADFFEICISSPNTTLLRTLQSEDLLDALLERLIAKADEMAALAGAAKRKPLWPKFAPDMAPDERRRALAACTRHLDPELDAVVMGNSTIDPAINPAVEKGGYSGRPLFPKALSEVRSAHRELAANASTAGPLTLVGCGGVFDGQNAFEMFEGGCKLVQLHTSFPYRGPGIAKKVREELLHAMERAKLYHVAEISGLQSQEPCNRPAVHDPTTATRHPTADSG